MTPSLEDLVVDFLQAREQAPDLRPEAFAAQHDRSDELLVAIQRALAASDLLPTAPGAAPPRTIGAYRVVRTIGRGGMGVVYEVERDGKRLALKWLPLAPALGERVHERLRREAQILQRLSHPHIVKVVDAGMHEETPFLVMELVDGRPLLDAAAALDVHGKVRLCAQLAHAVHAAHAQGIVHRDLKPQNVLVRADGSPVLLDFGLGHDDALPTLTSTGDLVGTPRYMAPEQVRTGHVDARTDVYALGAVLYELLTGAPAFPQAPREQALAAIARSAFAPPRRRQRDVPAALERIVMTAMAWAPARRLATAAAMASDLERFLAGQPVTARPPGACARMALAARLRPERTLASLAALALAAVATFWSLQPSPLDENTREQANAHYSRAATAWLDGDTNTARAELATVRSLHDAHAGAQTLQQHLDDDDLAALATALSPLPADPLTAAVTGLQALAQRDHERAERELAAAARALPPSQRLQQALGDAYRGLDRNADAERAYRQALATGPATARLWSALAEVYLDLENPDAGIDAAQHAMALSGQRSGRTARVLAMLHNSKRQFEPARTVLHAMLEHDPDDANAHYLLGFAHDSEHRPECVASYRRAIELDPGHTRALYSLANVHVGADRGHCAGCDRLYAEHPEFLDGDRATQLVLQCLRTRSGSARPTVQQLVVIARKLPDRTPVLTLLAELTNGKAKTPAVLNLQWLARQLEVSGSDGK